MVIATVEDQLEVVVHQQVETMVATMVATTVEITLAPDPTGGKIKFLVPHLLSNKKKTSFEIHKKSSN